MIIIRRFSVGAGILAAGVLLPLCLSGCGSQPASPGSGAAPANAGPSRQLTIITPHDPKIQFEFERGFKVKHPDTSIKWLSQQGTADALRFVESQFANKDKTKGINVDVFFGGGPEPFMDLAESDLLQPLGSTFGVPAKLNGVPFVGKNDTWIAAALSGFGILVNKQIATRDNLPLPQVWDDLANPKLRDRVELADPRHSGSAHVAYEIILQLEGWDKGWQTLTGLAANANKFIDSSSQLTQDVQGGEAVMAPAIDFYARDAVARASGDKLTYVAPRGQLVVTPDPIAILQGAPHRDLAKQFVAYVMSPAGQKLWMYKKGSSGGPTQNDLFRQAALPSLYKPLSPDSLVQENPYAAQNARPYDSATASIRRKVLDDLIGTVLIDNQKALKAKLAQNPNLSQVAFVPATEAEVAQLAAKWSDATARNAKLNEWGQTARQRFGG